MRWALFGIYFTIEEMGCKLTQLAGAEPDGNTASLSAELLPVMTLHEAWDNLWEHLGERLTVSPSGC